MSDIIGREEELAEFKTAFQKSMKGEGQTIILTGDAGIGKTSMTRNIVQWASDAGATAIIGHCSYGEKAEPYHPLRKALALIGETEALNLEEQTSFDEIFLISKTGLLMNHLSNLEGEAIDEDILSSMLTAVQDFVKDSFGDGENMEQKGGLGRLEYQNKKVLLEHGNHVFMAAVVSGEEHPVMMKDLQTGLIGLESDFGDIIRDWDGDLDEIEGTSVILQAMTDKKYRVKRDIESMNLDVERLKAFNGILDVVKEKSDKGLAIILEDVNWADENSLQAIPFLARNIGSSKIFLCLTLEGGSDSDEPETKRLLDTLGLEMTGQTIALEPLIREGVAQLIRHRLGTDMIPDGLLERLYSGSAGNPLFTMETMESQIKERIVVKKDELWIFHPEKEKSFPMTVQDIVARQLENLTHERLHTLEFGSVLGMRFGSESISIGTSIPQEKIDVILVELAKTDIISLDAEEYVFKHGMVREAVYDGLSPRWKRMLHASAGNALEFLYEYDIEPVLFR
ncbi:MAG: AAA family ATPase, partial [Thermoplasmata archaeon]|nr:AAA family ATPase [Thermoplasmata archaeon]